MPAIAANINGTPRKILKYSDVTNSAGSFGSQRLDNITEPAEKIEIKNKFRVLTISKY